MGYSSIQTSISGLQEMMSEHSAPRKKGIKKKKKKRRKSMVSTAAGKAGTDLLVGSSYDFMPSHLTPHLNDLDNLVQSVFEADQIDERHSSGNTAAKTAKLTKKRKSQTALLRASCPSCPSSVRPSSVRKKKSALWK